MARMCLLRMRRWNLLRCVQMSIPPSPLHHGNARMHEIIKHTYCHMSSKGRKPKKTTGFEFSFIKRRRTHIVRRSPFKRHNVLQFSKNKTRPSEKIPEVVLTSPHARDTVLIARKTVFYSTTTLRA